MKYAVQVFDSGQPGEVRLDDGKLVVEAPLQGHLDIVRAVEATFPGYGYWMNYQRLG